MMIYDKILMLVLVVYFNQLEVKVLVTLFQYALHVEDVIKVVDDEECLVHNY